MARKEKADSSLPSVKSAAGFRMKEEQNVAKGATKSVIEKGTGGGGRLVRGKRTVES